MMFEDDEIIEIDEKPESIDTIEIIRESRGERKRWKEKYEKNTYIKNDT